MKTLTQAALNADKTVEQVEDVLDGLGTSLVELNKSLSALNSTVTRPATSHDSLLLDNGVIIQRSAAPAQARLAAVVPFIFAVPL